VIIKVSGGLYDALGAKFGEEEALKMCFEIIEPVAHLQVPGGPAFSTIPKSILLILTAVEAGDYAKASQKSAELSAYANAIIVFAELKNIIANDVMLDKAVEERIASVVDLMSKIISNDPVIGSNFAFSFAKLLHDASLQPNASPALAAVAARAMDVFLSSTYSAIMVPINDPQLMKVIGGLATVGGMDYPPEQIRRIFSVYKQVRDNLLNAITILENDTSPFGQLRMAQALVNFGFVYQNIGLLNQGEDATIAYLKNNAPAVAELYRSLQNDYRSVIAADNMPYLASLAVRTKGMISNPGFGPLLDNIMPKLQSLIPLSQQKGTTSDQQNVV
jgi:hypothetical protein